MSGKKITVIIADDHPLIRAGVRHLLEKSADIQIIGEASDGREAVDLVDTLSPDLLLLDLEMPVLDGFQVLEALMARQAPVRVLFLTAQNDPFYIQEALNRGAWGYFCKDDSPRKLIETILRARPAPVAL